MHSLLQMIQLLFHVYPSLPKPHVTPFVLGLASTLPASSFRGLVADVFAPSQPTIAGPLKEGMYIQVGMGLGFYVPQLAFDECKRIANETHKIQFLTVTKEGEPIHATREECLQKGDGCVAWIVPE